VVDEDCRALSAADGGPIPGLYVVGDQKSGWNQIPEAWASAERAVLHAWAEYL
jgi:thioredoxin reductase